MALTAIKENERLRKECADQETRMAMAISVDDDHFCVKQNPDLSESVYFFPSQAGVKISIKSHDRQEWQVYCVECLYSEEQPRIFIEVMRGQQMTDRLDVYDLYPCQLDKIACLIDAIVYGFIEYKK